MMEIIATLAWIPRSRTQPMKNDRHISIMLVKEKRGMMTSAIVTLSPPSVSVKKCVN